MTTKAVFAIVTLTSVSLGSALFAKDLAAPEALALLSGKSLSCTSEGRPVTIDFSKADAKGRIKYKATVGGQKFSNSYRSTKKGKLVQGSSNAPRSVSVDGKGLITIKGRGVPTAVCK
ncbi:hypothetical protein KO498_03505 [Lentibacter algarum]|uniref:hypothetical protein n=1 Tax=Lentibacter algarum TaxID=576131 RepID=UPI001C078F52|nr:hypothetical protein [Lentibacter algarum]MBU2980872.1 hypothetical protein [Lentibacter algarum]